MEPIDLTNWHTMSLISLVRNQNVTSLKNAIGPKMSPASDIVHVSQPCSLCFHYLISVHLLFQQLARTRTVYVEMTSYRMSRWPLHQSLARIMPPRWLVLTTNQTVTCQVCCCRDIGLEMYKLMQQHYMIASSFNLNIGSDILYLY